MCHNQEAHGSQQRRSPVDAAVLLSKLARLLPPAPVEDAPLPNTRLPPSGPAGDDDRGRPDGALKGPAALPPTVAAPPAYTPGAKPEG